MALGMVEGMRRHSAMPYRSGPATSGYFARRAFYFLCDCEPVMPACMTRHACCQSPHQVASAFRSSAHARRCSDIVRRHEQLPGASQAPVRVGAQLQAASRRHKRQDGLNLRLRPTRLGLRPCPKAILGSVDFNDEVPESGIDHLRSERSLQLPRVSALLKRWSVRKRSNDRCELSLEVKP